MQKVVPAVTSERFSEDVSEFALPVWLVGLLLVQTSDALFQLQVNSFTHSPIDNSKLFYDWNLQLTSSGWFLPLHGEPVWNNFEHHTPSRTQLSLWKSICQKIYLFMNCTLFRWLTLNLKEYIDLPIRLLERLRTSIWRTACEREEVEFLLEMPLLLWDRPWLTACANSVDDCYRY